jgi:hypothetical protein
MQQNLISKLIPQLAAGTATQLLQQVVAVLKPYLKSLTPEERKSFFDISGSRGAESTI